MSSRDVMTVHWSQVDPFLAAWRRRVCSDELTSLSDRVLRDIGMSYCAAKPEASRPFWR
jgi:uncharacterized protein YjiS (DUF1127 family)